jgi:hypothetical protein
MVKIDSSRKRFIPEAFATISGIVKNKFVLSPYTAIFDASFKPHFHK